MGYERKRGALLELCRYLRGREGTTISTAFGNTKALSGTKYVITLDADTFMPIGTAKSLIGILQHPQNRPVVSGGKVVSGYAMVQPRVNIDLQGANQTMFTKIFAGLGGIDQYSTACYDLYQDTFGEGIFTGKGIFDVDVYLEVLNDAIPDNLVLSHDLLEGSYLRCAMATDLEFIDGYPAGYRSFVMRQTRWIRGDWQIIPWLFPKVKNALGDWVKNPLNHLSRWKIADNLRRSITPVFSLLLIFMAFGVLKGGLFWLWLTLGVEIFPFFLYLLNLTFSQRAGTQKYFSNIVYGLKSWLFQTTLGVVLLANNAIKAGAGYFNRPVAALRYAAEHAGMGDGL